MGGYRRLTNLLSGTPRGMNVFDQNNETYTHIGNGSFLQQTTIDPSGVVSTLNDRTPVGFPASVNNIWQFDNIYDTAGSGQSAIIAFAAPNALDISSNTGNSVYYGNVVGTAALTATAFPPVSGGVGVSGPFTWAFGTNGFVYWSPPNDPSNYGASGSGSARICAAKIVRSQALRAGPGNGPTTLFWSLNSLERATFVGGTSIFNFDTITDSTSILSADSVIEYNGVYFWIGVDSFLLFNGVVTELPNDMNINDFFDNLNYAYRSRVFAIKIPRFGEIWWCYPRGSATECTNAVIYNVRENSWYDTLLPNGGRSCGQYAQVFRSPLMTGILADNTVSPAGYKLWQHEFETDELDGTAVRAVYKAIESCEFSFPDLSTQDSGVGSKMNLVCNIVEPDFVQSMGMDMIVKGRANARAPTQTSNPYPFADTATVTAQQTLTIREANRYMRFRFESNITGGSFQNGRIWFHTQPGDARITS